MTTLLIALPVVAIIALIVAGRACLRRAVIFLVASIPDLPRRINASGAWARLRPFRRRLAERYPASFAFLARRLNPHAPQGLLLTLMLLAALYLAALFSGLTEDILEAQGTIHIDNFVNDALASWRVQPLVAGFGWITAMGGGPAAVSAVIVATGFLWSQRRVGMIVPLWVTCLGALATTTAGKSLVGRHRPHFTTDVSVDTWSFPSGHATTSMAVYGFIAYTIARQLPGIEERFEVAYWTSVLILLIGFSRIFLGVHYMTDVVGGFLVGGFWLLVGFTIAEWNRLRPTTSS